jgi:hypothetical protein
MVEKNSSVNDSDAEGPQALRDGLSRDSLPPRGNVESHDRQPGLDLGAPAREQPLARSLDADSLSEEDKSGAQRAPERGDSPE